MQGSRPGGGGKALGHTQPSLTFFDTRREIRPFFDLKNGFRHVCDIVFFDREA